MPKACFVYLQQKTNMVDKKKKWQNQSLLEKRK